MRTVALFVPLSLLAVLPGCFDTEGLTLPNFDTGSSTCKPQAITTCKLDHECLARADNTGKDRFALAFDRLDIQWPDSLAILSYLVDSAFEPAEPTCDLAGTQPSRVLIVLDEKASTLTLGSAKSPDASGAFAFDDRDVEQGNQAFHVGPVSFQFSRDDNGAIAVTTAEDVVLPLVLEGSGQDLVLPLHAAVLTGVNLSKSQNCIGTFDTGWLAGGTACDQFSVPSNPFSRDGKIDGFVTLEEADAIRFFGGDSLCALLTMDADKKANGVAVCKRSNKVITARGDWCSSLNSPATATCADALRIEADFGARAVPFVD